MIGIAITFSRSRFHATPWGRHVNEAVPEWPPSPWRILRAFVATWKRKLDQNIFRDCDVVEHLIRKLSEPPLFVLPPASIGHTRSYMPWFKKGRNDRTLVFDSFVCVDKTHAVICLWLEAALEMEERKVFELLSSHLGFLGRAESWVEGRMLTDEEAELAYAQVNCRPMDGTSKDAAFDAVRVLCADPDSAFSNEHTPKQCLTKGRGKDSQMINTAIYNPDWHLCMETLDQHEKQWADPPGSKWVTYLRRKDCFMPRLRIQKNLLRRSRPTIAHYAIDGTVLPTVEETLLIAELARRTVMGVFRRIEEKRLYNGNVPEDAPLPRSEVFSGKDFEGRPLEGHRHAYYIPSDEDGDGRIDHLTIVAAMGFGAAEVKALDAMRRLKREQGEPLNLVLLALGMSSEITIPKLMGPSCVWTSATPFITTRFPKVRGKKRDPLELLGSENQHAFVRRVLIEELEREYADLPAPLEVNILSEEMRCGARGLRPIQFKRYRRKAGDDGGRRPAGVFRITFAEAVSGPLCLGHSSHFGMGLFVPEVDKK